MIDIELDFKSHLKNICKRVKGYPKTQCTRKKNDKIKIIKKKKKIVKYVITNFIISLTLNFLNVLCTA